MIHVDVAKLKEPVLHNTINSTFVRTWVHSDDWKNQLIYSDDWMNLLILL